VLNLSRIALRAKQNRKEEQFQKTNLPLYLEKLEKEQTKPKISRKKEIIKTGEELNEKKNRKGQQN
jgi:hypothetical protein